MYEIVFTKDSLKQLSVLQKKDRVAIINKIEGLTKNPKPQGFKPLKGNLSSYFRIRHGDYRVIYSIEENKFIIVIVKIGNRKNIY